MEVLGKILGKKREDVVSSADLPESPLVDLPRETFIEIFKKLDFGSLANAALVNRQWRDVGEDPRIWSSFPLICTEEMAKNLKTILVFRRFSLLRSIKLTHTYADPNDPESKPFNVTDDYLETILDHGNIVDMELELVEMEQVTIPIIKRMARELSVLRLFSISSWCKLVDNILMELNVASEDNDKCLQELGINKLNWMGQKSITTVNSEIFGHTLTLLKSISLRKLSLSESQITSLLSNMKKEGSKIYHLVMEDEHMSNINPSLISSALGCLKSLKLISNSNPIVTPLQMEILIKEISLRKTMTHLHLNSINLDSVDPEVFAEVTQNLEDLHLEACGNTTEQMIAFMSNLALLEHPKMKYLFLNFCDMTSVPAKLLGKQLSRIKVIKNLRFISPDQVSALLLEIVEGSDSVVEELIIDGNGGMNEIELSLMAEGLNKLRRVGLFYTGLEGKHITAILNRSLQGTKLRFIDFRHCCDKEEPFEKAVSKELVEKAKALIPEIWHPLPKEKRSLLNPINMYRAVAEIFEDSD